MGIAGQSIPPATSLSFSGSYTLKRSLPLWVYAPSGFYILSLRHTALPFTRHWHHFNVFAHKKNITGKFVATPITEWLNDTSNSGHQYLTITIPVSDAQYDLLSSIHKQYVQQSPYDYAFIGMRCANATYDILSKGGFFPVYSRSKNIRKHFYPKPLRKKMVRWAKQHNYPMVFLQGSDRRKWEKDWLPLSLPREHITHRHPQP